MFAGKVPSPSLHGSPALQASINFRSASVVSPISTYLRIIRAIGPVLAAFGGQIKGTGPQPFSSGRLSENSVSITE